MQKISITYGHCTCTFVQGVDKSRALGAQREHLVIMVAKDLHTKQPWYHGKISREESEKRLKASRHKDGKFL